MNIHSSFLRVGKKILGVASGVMALIFASGNTDAATLNFTNNDGAGEHV